MSRLALAHPATRPADPGRVLISGPPGAGCTETAIVVATALADGAPVLVIDTDHPRSLDVADRFTFTVLPWDEPHDPAELATTVTEAGDTFGAVVIDTITAQWVGKGGTLETGHGGDWDAARAAQRRLLAAIRETPAHVVATCDTDVFYQVDEDGQVRRLGTVLRHDSDIESRYQVALTLDTDHVLRVTNSPGPALPFGASWGPGRAAEFAHAYAEWLEMGEHRASDAVVEEIKARIAMLPGTRADRDAVRAEVKRITGPKVTDLRQRDVERVSLLISTFEPVHGPELPDPWPPEPVEATDESEVAA